MVKMLVLFTSQCGADACLMLEELKPLNDLKFREGWDWFGRALTSEGMNLALKSCPVAFKAVWGYLALANKLCAEYL